MRANATMVPCRRKCEWSCLRSSNNLSINTCTSTSNFSLKNWRTSSRLKNYRGSKRPRHRWKLNPERRKCIKVYNSEKKPTIADTLRRSTMQRACAVTVTTNTAVTKKPGTAPTINFTPTECARIATSIATIAKEEKNAMKNQTLTTFIQNSRRNNNPDFRA